MSGGGDQRGGRQICHRSQIVYRLRHLRGTVPGRGHHARGREVAPDRLELEEGETPRRRRTAAFPPLFLEPCGLTMRFFAGRKNEVFHYVRWRRGVRQDYADE